MTMPDRPYSGVTVFGGVTLDRVAKTDGPAVLGASNPGMVRRLPGGVGFNVATILARLGVRTRFVSRVGADADGESILTSAREMGIETGGLGVSPTGATAGYHATFDNEGNLVVGVADMKICDEITPASLARMALSQREGDFWIIDANLPAESIAFLVEEAAQAGTPVAALTVSPAKALRFVPVLDRLSYVFTNRREAASMLGLDPNDAGLNVARLAAELARTRSAYVIVTNGGESLAAAHGADVRSFVPFRATITGVNGAGDSFAAGSIEALVHGYELKDAIRHGLAAAAMTLEAGTAAAAPFQPGILAAGAFSGRDA